MLDIEYDTPEDHGYIHEKDLPDLVYLRSQVISLSYAAYMSGSTVDMRSALIEICEELDVIIPTGEMAIERKNLSDNLQWHLGYQRCILDNLNK